MAILNEPEIQALLEALDDEHHAWATYDQVISDFGEVLPFTNIRAAEARHIDALGTLFVRYDIPMPGNPWPGKVPRYPSLAAACEAGLQSEITNAALYDRLIVMTDRPDILTVLENLRAASQERHLPAFRRALERPGEVGCGLGPRLFRGGRSGSGGPWTEGRGKARTEA
jgi:hypothetical protein